MTIKDVVIKSNNEIITKIEVTKGSLSEDKEYEVSGKISLSSEEKNSGGYVYVGIKSSVNENRDFDFLNSFSTEVSSTDINFNFTFNESLLAEPDFIAICSNYLIIEAFLDVDMVAISKISQKTSTIYNTIKLLEPLCIDLETGVGYSFKNFPYGKKCKIFLGGIEKEKIVVEGEFFSYFSKDSTKPYPEFTYGDTIFFNEIITWQPNSYFSCDYNGLVGTFYNNIYTGYALPELREELKISRAKRTKELNSYKDSFDGDFFHFSLNVFSEIHNSSQREEITISIRKTFIVNDFCGPGTGMDTIFSEKITPNILNEEEHFLFDFYISERELDVEHLVGLEIDYEYPLGIHTHKSLLEEPILKRTLIINPNEILFSNFSEQGINLFSRADESNFILSNFLFGANNYWSDWKFLELSSSKASYHTDGVPKIRMNLDGEIEILGKITTTGQTADSLILATLPPQCTPLTTQYYIARGTGRFVFAKILLTNDGYIKMHRPQNAAGDVSTNTSLTLDLYSKIQGEPFSVISTDRQNSSFEQKIKYYPNQPFIEDNSNIFTYSSSMNNPFYLAINSAFLEDELPPSFKRGFWQPIDSKEHFFTFLNPNKDSRRIFNVKNLLLGISEDTKDNINTIFIQHLTSDNKIVKIVKLNKQDIYNENNINIDFNLKVGDKIKVIFYMSEENKTLKVDYVRLEDLTFNYENYWYDSPNQINWKLL